MVPYNSHKHSQSAFSMREESAGHEKQSGGEKQE